MPWLRLLYSTVRCLTTVRKVTVTPTSFEHSELIFDYTYTAGTLKTVNKCNKVHRGDYEINRNFNRLRRVHF